MFVDILKSPPGVSIWYLAVNIIVSQCLELDSLSMYVQGHTGPNDFIGPLSLRVSELKVLDVEMRVIQYDHLELKQTSSFL